ncbi:Heat shock factor protein 3 [Varanus komodoensis]|nr:Heat shock factor protein 3 [Varanus komodoensis]
MSKAGATEAAATAAAEPGRPGAAPVPGFLAKLWALVEDSGSDDVIAWGRNGQNFCILDEQRFAKELLPKYFKHNNLSSFIRQLNIYGFRKVIALENGMMTSDKNSAIEFQHPFFKRGKANLLGNIKRKVSAVRAEDLKLCPESLHKVLSEVQEMREQQNNMDIKLASMKRENKALWKEVAYLRQKHSQQQRLLSKILEFILGLMRGKCILELKRKRPLADSSSAPPSKYSRPFVRIPVQDCEAAAISEHSPDCEDSIIIRDITDAQEEEEEEEEEEDGGTEKLLALVHTSNGNREAQAPAGETAAPCGVLWTPDAKLSEGARPVQLRDASCTANAVELHPAQGGAAEDPAAVIDSILSENQTVAQSDSLLERAEIQDFLNCIDASLEELQAMLSGKKFNYAADTLTEAFSPELPATEMNLSDVPPSLENVRVEGFFSSQKRGQEQVAGQGCGGLTGGQASCQNRALGGRIGGESGLLFLVLELHELLSKEQNACCISVLDGKHQQRNKLTWLFSMFTPVTYDESACQVDSDVMDSASWSKTLAASVSDVGVVSVARKSSL